MSSFLMNTGPAYHQAGIHHQAVDFDPKFPPSEEYSQGNYMPADFFHHPPQQQYGGYYHHQAAGTPYHAGYGYSNYYQDVGQGNHLPPEAQQPPPLLGVSGQVPSAVVRHDESPESSPCHLRSPPPVHHNGHDDSDQESVDDDETLDDGSPLPVDDGSESGERVIYPWMKKIHVAGVGKRNCPIMLPKRLSITIGGVLLRSGLNGP